MRHFSTITLGAWLLLIGGACSHGSEIQGDLASLKREAVTNYATVMSAAFQDSLAGAENLRRAVGVLLESPSEGSLKAARQAWLEARVPYLQTEVSRFYDGPIDEVEGMINSWPIDEHYVDYVVGDPKAGIINETTKYPSISRELIVSLNEREGEKNISTGYHAIEFLLWGQDLSTNGPGNRSWLDYEDGTKNAGRRRQYLRIVTDLLAEHLQRVVTAWAEGNPKNYRAEFVALDPDVALARILKGMGAFSGPELSGERLTVAYETKEQEEEHSCFSDNTHNDFHYDALGIQNVYLGHYTCSDGRKIKGPGLHDLLERVDSSFAGKLSAQIQASVTAVCAIPAPFDQAILGPNTAPGRVAIKKAITALQTQSDLIAQAAAILSLKLNL